MLAPEVELLVRQCHADLLTFLRATLDSTASRFFVRALQNAKFMDAAAPVDQRAALRAAYIAMPAELCARLPDDILLNYDALLQKELSLARVVESASLPSTRRGGMLFSVWQGDMSLLKCDAVVNPCNSALLGCFLPSHRCLDNILHAQSGPRLRIACAEMLNSLGIAEDANGNCRVTPGFALPSSFVFHTVGPDLSSRNGPPRPPTKRDADELSRCYSSCLDAADSMGNVRSVAFCCISTGIFGFPQKPAAEIALSTCEAWCAARAEKQQPASLQHIIFNVFKDEDLAIYSSLLTSSNSEELD